MSPGGSHREGLTEAQALFDVVFAFVLLGKNLLDVRFGTYGFVLAVPASCAVIAFLTKWSPPARLN